MTEVLEADDRLRTGAEDAELDAAALAELLSGRLDEPEAHLDMARREQLGELLADFAGAVVIVSHDRHLLDQTVAEIAELDRGTVRIWPGAYSAYAVARQLELERQKQLLAGNAAPRAQLDRAEATRDSAAAQLARAEASLAIAQQAERNVASILDPFDDRSATVRLLSATPAFHFGT